MFHSDFMLLPFLGSLLLGGAFVFAGLRNLANVPFLTGALAARGVPLAKAVLFAGIALQCGAGALFMAGVFPVYAAAALIVFIVTATLIFHNFWDHEGVDRVAHVNGVVSNVALCGSLLLIMANG